MNARDAILQAIRRANANAAAALPDAPPPYRRHGEMDAAAREARFIQRLEAYGVHVTVVESEAEVAPATTARLAAAGVARAAAPADLPAAWRTGAVDWLDADALDPAALDAAPAAVTGCALGVAETGSLILDGGAGQGRRVLSLLPDHHICVVRADQLVETVPEALRRLAAEAVRTHPLTFISGPSATADIEFDRVAGVHGPRRLDVVLVRHCAA